MSLLKIFTDGANDSTIPNTNTEKWLACTYAPWTVYFGGDWQYIAGVKEKTAQRKERLRFILSRDWGVNGRESLLDTVSLLTVMYCEENAPQKADIVAGAWDLCRACQILSIGFVCDYITRREMMDLSIKTGKIMQRLYRSWDELYESYLRGYAAWRRSQSDDGEDDIAERRKICQRLKREPDGPASLKWQTELKPPTFFERIKSRLRMTKANVVALGSVVISLIIASSFFLGWNPERLLQSQTPVTQSDIQRDRAKDFAGAVAGQDIPRLQSGADLARLPYRSGYATAQPLAVVSTGVHSLQPWVDPYYRQTFKGRTSTAKRRKPQIIQSALPVVEGYSQYYLLQLPDKSYILAQIPPNDAKAIAKGESVTLPISKKTGLTASARKALLAVCQKYNVKANGVVYAFNDQWQKDNFFLLFIIRFAAAALLFFVLALVLMKAGNTLFKVKEA